MQKRPYLIRSFLLGAALGAGFTLAATQAIARGQCDQAIDDAFNHGLAQGYLGRPSSSGLQPPAAECRASVDLAFKSGWSTGFLAKTPDVVVSIDRCGPAGCESYWSNRDFEDRRNPAARAGE
jgi:hypothetical protein